MTKILGLFPQNGNGGIVSWAINFITSFSNEEIQLVPVDTSLDKDFVKLKGISKYIYGFKAFMHTYYKARKVIYANPDIRIMHTTTSAAMGTLRDYLMVRLCKKKGIKCIMHCHFGCITELYESKDKWCRMFRKNIELYDQIWVLDQRSADFLRTIPSIRNKIMLTPNSIDVPDAVEIKASDYKKIGFIGNIIPSKGIFELIQAVKELSDDTHLYIAGIGADKDIDNMISLIGNNLDRNIHFMGKLPNPEAVRLMESLDIVCLPTYFFAEAFPISILEAMSRGKLVISCPKAAIPDMLSMADGSLCGILVADRSASELAEAIKWCQNHPLEALEMRKKAYEKVKACYRKEVVYDIYRQNYRKLL